MERNRIEQVPATLAHCTKLGVFNANFNRLTQLPVELGSLKHVMVLTVKGNHMQQPPVDVCDIDADSIVFFLKHLGMGTPGLLWRGELDGRVGGSLARARAD